MSQQTRESALVSSSNQSNRPDYEALEIPTKNPAEYTYAERRAELLQTVLDLGHPSLVNQTAEAERYDVTQQQISQDLDRLAEYIDDNLGNRRELTTEAVYHRCITGLLEEGEYRKAAQTVSDWNEWITEHKDLQELAEDIDALKARQEGQR